MFSINWVFYYSLGEQELENIPTQGIKDRLCNQNRLHTGVWTHGVSQRYVVLARGLKDVENAEHMEKCDECAESVAVRKWT